MPDQATPTTTTPSQPAAPAAPRTNADRRAAALSILESASKAQPEPVEASPEAAGAAAPVEPAPAKPSPDLKAAPKEPEKKPEPRDAARFAAIARKEAQLVARQQEAKRALEAERAKFEAERAEFSKLKERVTALQEAAKAFEAAKTNARRDPLALLQSVGLSYEDATQYVLNNKQPTADMLARDSALRAEQERMEAWRKEQEAALVKQREDFAAERKKFAEEEKARLERQKKAMTEQFHREVLDFVKNNASQYELTALYEQGGLVIQVLEEHYAQTGRAMKYEEAAGLVEKHMEELAEKALASNKIKSRLQPPKLPPVEGEKPREPAPAKRTITNTMTASTPSPRARTKEDRMRAALAILDKA